ncbi:MAG TPA: hybrid sensor histidine kinase/response regulator [Kofleriaceae bacterium]|nr:hybrid sensor histidine kinase/response regulator [Kofleriaceae bacterium]
MEEIHARPRILIVDDNAENRALARATLEDEGYEALLAANGEDGVRAFEAARPDCVLLDVRMAGMDGFAVCARIRELPGGADTPVIFLTALRDVDTFDRALGAGGDDFVTKPVRPTELALRVQSALKLRRMSAELRQHYELVRRQRDDLMRLQLQKERLTSFVVHDLKNPVNTMDLHAQLLLRDPDLPERARRSVQSIRTEARSLLRLVLNLLDISRSEEGQLSPQPGPVDLRALFRDLVEAHEVAAQTAGVRLEQTVEVSTVTADPDLLRRAIENLLDNALRHAPEGTAIRLAARGRAGGVEIRVADQGPGISPELRDKVFERFVRVESGERLVTRTGRGLGLAFCKLAAEAHGGTIEVEDGLAGASFCMRFPGG